MPSKDLRKWAAVLAIFFAAFLARGAAADTVVDPAFDHCVDDPNIPAENIVASCKTYINEAYMQNWGMQYVPKALHSQALAYGRLGKLAEAKKALAIAVKQAPDYFAAWETLVEQQMGLTGIQANETAADAMIKNAPSDWAAQAQACIVRTLDKQSSDVTMADCDEGVRLGPSHDYAFQARCLARYKLGDLPNAVADCDAALKLEPKNAIARYIEGLVKVQMGFKDSGNADIAAAEALDSDIKGSDEFAYPNWY